MGLDGRVVLVTGAGGGIGLEIANRCAADGARVVVADLDAEAAKTVSGGLTDAGAESFAVAADVGDPESVGAMVERTVDAFGGVDALVNNAGVRFNEPFAEYRLSSWDATLAVNLTGPFLCTQACLPHLRASEGGRVINIASTTGILASANRVAYCASKAGVIGLTKATATELGPLGVTVNAVAPGLIETPLTAVYFKQEGFVRRVREEIPAGRWGQVAEVAAVVSWLAGPDSSYVSGTVIPVDGAWVAGKEFVRIAAADQILDQEPA